VSFTGFVSRINRHVQARRRRASRIETDDWMLAAPALSVVDRLARMEQPELVLELGSGRSTIVLADAVASYGGRLVSLEHDPRYYRRTQEWLGSRANVELRLAPITIVVDDTQRDKESDMVRRWIDAYGLRVVEVLDHPGGDELTVLRRGHA
jgi:predicted O-methyltransferase YrrM